MLSGGTLVMYRAREKYTKMVRLFFMPRGGIFFKSTRIRLRRHGGVDLR